MNPRSAASTRSLAPRRGEGAVGAQRNAALLSLLLASCVPPCPDTYPLCIETDGGSCRAWSAGCCMGIVACAKGTMFAEDAGTCAVVEVPAEKRVVCQ